MLKENGSGLGVLMSFPGQQKVSHDQDDVAPTGDILRSALSFEIENLVMEEIVVPVLAHVVIGHLGKSAENFLDARFGVVDPAEVPIPQVEPGVNFRRQNLELASQDPGFEMKQVVEVGVCAVGIWECRKICFLREIVGFHPFLREARQ